MSDIALKGLIAGVLVFALAIAIFFLSIITGKLLAAVGQPLSTKSMFRISRVVMWTIALGSIVVTVVGFIALAYSVSPSAFAVSRGKAFVTKVGECRSNGSARNRIYSQRVTIAFVVPPRVEDLALECHAVQHGQIVDIIEDSAGAVLLDRVNYRGILLSSVLIVFFGVISVFLIRNNLKPYRMNLTGKARANRLFSRPNNQ